MGEDRDEALRRRRLIFWHELKSPAGTLQTLVDVLRDGSAGELPADARDLLERARRQLDRLGGMIAAAHDLERLQAGRLAFADERCDLAALLRSAVEAVRPAALAKGLRLDLQGEESAGTRLDPLQAGRCVDGLVRAAIEATIKAEAIALSVSQAEGGFAIRAQARMQPALLDDPFGPAGALGLRGGVGVGLLEARLLAEAMGGRARVTVDGERATIELWFPQR
jgi:signal transduction histidine kinase